MAKVSIVVPVYNSERYLERCIDSIRNQTLEDWELILVNDGSLDDSGKICDAWARRDSRIRAVHKENGGPQSAVIAGIQTASSKVIGFCDSDDYVAGDYYETLYHALEESKADMVCCKFCLVYDDRALQHNADKSSRILSSKEILDSFWETTGQLLIGNNRYTKLFKKEKLETLIEELNPTLCMGEDGIQVLLYLERCGKVCCLEGYNGYFYREVPASLMNLFSDRQIHHSRLFIRELEKVAKEYRHGFAMRNAINDSLMSSLLYKCAASDAKISAQTGYIRIILSELSDKDGILEKYLKELNPVLKLGFQLILHGFTAAGLFYCKTYIHLVRRLIGK